MYTFKAMNTNFLLAGLPETVSKAIHNKIWEYERVFSRFSPDSELTRINASGGSYVQVGDDLRNCLRTAIRLYHETNGIFNPFLKTELEEAGYDVSFELLADAEKKEKHCNIMTGYGPDGGKVNFSPSGKVALTGGRQLDLGGIAKGWSGEQCMHLARRNGCHSGLVDAGGDIAVWGNDIDGGPWLIGMANPFQPGEDAADILVRDAACVATSSVLKRSWHSDGIKMHHIIDPRTGQPAKSDFVQLSIWSHSLSLCEAYAKYGIITGRAGLDQLFGKRNDMAAVAFTLEGELLKYGDLDKFVLEMKVL